MFDPKQYLTQLPGRRRKDGSYGPSTDYLEVKYRLLWLRTDHPDAVIATDAVVRGEDEVWFKATVTLPSGGSATGWAKQTPADFAGNTAYVEKCECVSTDVEMLTHRGFRHHSSLRIGEPVAAYDPILDRLYWTPLQEVKVYHDAAAVRLHNRTFDCICTPNHSWMINRAAGRQLVPTSKLLARDSIIIGAVAEGGTAPLSPRHAAIIGWIVCDGTIKRESVASLSVTITQSKPETVAILRDLLGDDAHESVGNPTVRTFPSGRTYDCLPQHAFRLKTEVARRLFQYSGIEGPADLPALVTQLSQPARAAMLHAMMLADGDARGRFGKKRKPGVQDAWQILTTLEGKPTGRTHLSSAGAIPLQKSKKRRTISASTLSLEDTAPTDVWCPTTASGTWVARSADGRTFITGNTKAIGRALGALGYGTQFTDDFDEEEHAIADAPVEHRAAPVTSAPQSREDAPQRPPPARQAQPATSTTPVPKVANPSGKITGPQVLRIRSYCEGDNPLRGEDLTSLALWLYGGKVLELSEKQADDLLTRLGDPGPLALINEMVNGEIADASTTT